MLPAMMHLNGWQWRGWLGLVIVVGGLGNVRVHASAVSTDPVAQIRALGAATWTEREAAQSVLQTNLTERPEVYAPAVLARLIEEDDPEIRFRLEAALQGAFTLKIGEAMLGDLAAGEDPVKQLALLGRLRGLVVEALLKKPKGYLGAHIVQDTTSIDVSGADGPIHGIRIMSFDEATNCLAVVGVAAADRLVQVGPYWCRIGAFEIRDLIAYVACLDPGTPLDLRLEREGEILALRVTLAERPERSIIERTEETETLFFEWWMRMVLDPDGGGGEKGKTETTD